MTPVSAARGLARRLVEGARLAEVRLPAELSAAEGVFRGQAVRFEGSAWASEKVSWARLACIEGPGISIGNLLAVGRPSRGLPVFGLDLVQVKAEEVIVAADLVATDLVAADLMATEGIPAWARGFFSTGARVLRVAPEQLEGELPSLEGLIADYLGLVAADRVVAQPSAVHARQSEYLRVHRTEDPGMRLLPAMFGAELGARLLAELLFPEAVQ